MARPVANVDITTETFGSLIAKTNILADALSKEIITANSTVDVTGSVASKRYAQLFGGFAANTVYANDYLSGGNNSGTNLLTIVSNTNFTGNTVIFSLNTAISANGALGTAGQLLYASANGVYWSALQTLYLPGTGIFSNTVGSNTTFSANASYIVSLVNPGTGITSNNTGGVTLSVNAAYITSLIAPGAGLTASIASNVETLTVNSSYIQTLIIPGTGLFSNTSAGVTTISVNAAFIATTSSGISPGTGIFGNTSGNVTTLSVNSAYITSLISPGAGLTASIASNVETLSVNSVYLATQSSNNAAYFGGQLPAFYIDIPTRLGFTPVQQGGGTGQGANKVYIGWNGSNKINVQIDGSSFGSTWPIDIAGASASVTGVTLQGQLGTGSSPQFAGLTIYSDNGGTYGGGWSMRNTAAGASNVNKFFRIGPTGTLEFINNAYSLVIAGLTDSGIFNAINITCGGQQVLHGGNYNAYAPTLTGGAASGQWNISAYPRRSDGTNINFFWSGQAGQPSYLLGSNDGVNFYAYNPSNFSVSYAASAGALTTSSNYQINSLGVNTSPSGTAGEIRATNNITAYYSDRRLKTNITPINGSLAKLKTLTGVYFRENDLAKTFGYDNNNRQVGVIAQEVEAVLPEVVVSAPFDTGYKDGVEYSLSGENYKTVQYDKLVPLLIEAIKELSAEVDDLKKRLA